MVWTILSYVPVFGLGQDSETIQRAEGPAAAIRMQCTPVAVVLLGIVFVRTPLKLLLAVPAAGFVHGRQLHFGGSQGVIKL